VAGGFLQISHTMFSAYRVGRPSPLADRSGDYAIQLNRCDGPPKPAILRSGVFIAFVAEGSARWQPSSLGSNGHMVVRIPWHRFCMVGSLAAHPGDGSRRIVHRP
jgi:hypothetical protein